MRMRRNTKDTTKGTHTFVIVDIQRSISFKVSNGILNEVTVIRKNRPVPIISIVKDTIINVIKSTQDRKRYRDDYQYGVAKCKLNDLMKSLK